VFLFNHRKTFDIFIVAALVKDNWTGIAKEGTRDPTRWSARSAN